MEGLFVIQSPTLYKPPSELTDEQNQVVNAACRRGNMLGSKLALLRHQNQESIDALMDFLRNEEDADEAIHALIQALFSTMGLLHAVGHLVEPAVMASVDATLDQAQFAAEVNDDEVLARLWADILAALPEEEERADGTS